MGQLVNERLKDERTAQLAPGARSAPVFKANGITDAYIA